MYRRTVYKVISPDSRRRIALQCVDLLLPGVTLAQRKKVASRILTICSPEGQLKEISEDRLLDVAYKLLQVNRTYLCRDRKGTHLERRDHRPYFKRHLKILRALLDEARQ
jgi:hypothetical protein